MKKLSTFLLVTWLAIFISTSPCYGEKESKQDKGEQQQTASKIRLSLNLKKGFSCQVVYNAKINISREGKSDGKGEWEIKARFLLTCDDVNDKGIMTISQSPLKISIEGTDIEGKHDIDFRSPDKNRQIPDLVRGYLNSLIAIISAKLDADGKIIAARQSPYLDNYDFMMTGKISYQDDPEWISSDDSKDAEKQVESIVRSMLVITPIAIGEEFTIGKTLTKKKKLENEGQTQETYNWTLKDIKDHIAQIEVKGNSSSESRIPEILVDEVEHYNSSSETLLEVNIDTGLLVKCVGVVEDEHKTMTYIPILSERVPTFSNSSKTNYTIEVVDVK